MLILRHLKVLQNVPIIIQIIFREFISSLLNSLNLKFKNVKSCSPTYLPTQTLRTYTKRYATA